MKLARDRTTRALFVGGHAPGSWIGFVVERLASGNLDFRIIWRDAEYGIGHTFR